MIGIINVNKESNMTSSNVVVKIRKLAGEKRVGHMGTLDPLAMGVLPICIGKATRLFNYFLKKNKTYIATFQFGKETDTLDLEGEVIKTSTYIPNKEEIETTINKYFTGKISQIPPQYSSKKIDGKKSYQIARSGNTVELKPCEIEIFSYKLIKQISPDTFEFEISCSSGTYIRSLARDLGEKTNSCCTMIKLIRTQCGNFNLSNSVKLDDLTSENISNYLIPLEEVLKDFPRIDLNEELFSKIRNGIRTQYKGAKIDGYFFTVYYQNKLIGIGNLENGYIKIPTYFI